MTVKRLRELERAATPGPWEYRPGGLPVTGSVYATSDKFPVVAKPKVADALLIAAARNALPLLLDVAEAAIRFRDDDNQESWLDLVDALAALTDQETE